MDGSDHKSSSSSSISIKQRPSFPNGVDENGKIYQENDKPTKTTSSKHFMSPTISASSKFNPSRKKILAERNESLDTPQKNPNLDSKSVQKATSLDSNLNSSTESGESEQNSRPYDPLINYLSPRPKFLRYNPNRRRQILIRRENEEKVGENDVLEHQKGLDSEGDLASSCGSLPQLEGDETDESDDDFEEVEDERGWSCSGPLKFLMLLLVLVLSTSYISSMNSPTPSPVVQAVAGLRDGYQLMQDLVYEYVNRNFLLFDQRIVEVRIEESMNEWKEEKERVIEIVEDAKVERETEKNEGEGNKDEEDTVELDGGEGETVIEMVEDAEVEGEAEKNEGERSEYGESVELDEENEKGEGEVDTFIEGNEDDETVEEEEEWNEITELDGGKISDFSDPQLVEMVEVVEIPSSTVTIVADALEKEEEAAVQEPIKEGIFESERGRIGNVTDVSKNGDEDAAGIDMIKEFIKGMETEPLLKAAIGLSIVLFSVIASMVLLGRRLHSRKSRNEGENTSPPISEPCFESLIAEKCSSLIPDDEEKPVVSAANIGISISKSLINSMGENDSKANDERTHQSFSHQSRVPPTIELLGELEVSEMSISLRSCGVKNSRVIESEVSSHSHSVSIVEKKTLGSKPNSYSVHVQPSSAFFHPSYSDEKKPTKKKESEGEELAEGKNVVTTPLRRSSRIRNRAISP